MSDKELMQQALEALEINNQAWKQLADSGDAGFWEAEEQPFYGTSVKAMNALRERLAKPVQEFTTHEENEDGWSDWVCPDPQSYLMKCCDCGLVHETQFGVVRYKSEAEREDCEKVDDPNLQAVFRMRRREEWTPEDTAHRPGGLAQPEQEPVRLQCTTCGTVYADGVPPQVPEQEPVAWVTGWHDGRCVIRAANPAAILPIGIALYTTPPRREWVGLTKEEAKEISLANRPYVVDMIAALEARLKEKNNG